MYAIVELNNHVRICDEQGREQWWATKEQAQAEAMRISARNVGIFDVVPLLTETIVSYYRACREHGDAYRIRGYLSPSIN